MKKTLIGTLAVAAMLCCTLNVQAVPQITRVPKSITAYSEAGVTGQSPNAGSIDDDCTTDGFPLGTLTRFMTIPADTTGLANDFEFDALCVGGCGGVGFYGAGAADGVAKFQVPVSGTWRFQTCQNPSAGLDTSLQLNTGTCVAGTCVTNADDECGTCADTNYKSVITAALVSGQDYWLIVDGFGGSGAVSNVLVTGPCTTAADCQDGLFCNGAELCTTGMCAAAAAGPCSGSTPLCDESTDSCTGCASNPSVCLDNGLFCDGPGACLPSGACGQAGNPCQIFQACNEATDACDNPDPCLAWQVGGLFTGGSYSPNAANGCADQGQADDAELSAHAGRDVIYYETNVIARGTAITGGVCPNGNQPPPDGTCTQPVIGQTYSVTMTLREAVTGGVCLPGPVIPNSTCVVTTDRAGAILDVKPGGTPMAIVRCDAAGGMGAVTIADADDDPLTGQCGVDAYVSWIASGIGHNGTGPSIGTVQQSIGGPAMDDEFQPANESVWAFPTCDPSNGIFDGTWGFGDFGPGFITDFRNTRICTDPVGPCCDGDGGCDAVTEAACTAAGGTYLGDNTLPDPNTCDSPDGDGDGVRDECDLCPADPDKTAPGQCGCGFSDADFDMDGTADCIDECDQDPGKIEPGICGCGIPDTDSDLDGTADCQDQCPNDPNKVVPGICGCGVAETGDTDGDGVSDCVDQCPGVDDAVFFPGCQGAIPTVSEWGMVVLALLLLAGAKVYFGRRTVQA